MSNRRAHMQRRCIGCMQSAGKWELVRFVWDGEKRKLAADLAQREPGRGVYVHPRRACIEKACGAKRWERALRLEPGTLKDGGLEDVRRVVKTDDGAIETGRRGGRVRL